ncbi:nucleoside diphosphate-linked moiety X motif 19 [Synchiropus splendidus]|uniref:nucleoside diphosphate-linked moiety X motif 19 n=1 Tax=Synchiropus splendidus TaxID=270530 RepID=UPI00237E48D9|nr:nucleoside diphosphate-linked moiety X motif 19 [Synchiropus splendidus]
MNTALKYWKEAATVILTAGQRSLGADSLSSRTPVSSAALTPADSAHGRTLHFDYDVLMLKRSSRSGFMPNAYVFPGGLVDSSDFSGEWLDVFKPFAHLTHFGLRRVEQPPESRPPMFATDRRTFGSPITGDVAFRICALRETFEESGVLLFVAKHERESVLDRLREGRTGEPLRDSAKELTKRGELSRWRTLVNQDPSNFIRMCKELQLVPNIWALHEWGNWLTPVGRDGAARFDTAFFICCLQEVPDTLQDQKEIVRFQWSTPAEVLKSYRDRQLWIAPPQFYELSRMCRLTRLDDLHRFSSERAVEGCEQWLPVLSSDGEGSVSALPGDRLHPLSVHSNPEADASLHRFVGSEPYTVDIQMTIPPKYKHLQPLIGHQDSKL